MQGTGFFRRNKRAKYLAPMIIVILSLLFSGCVSPQVSPQTEQAASQPAEVEQIPTGESIPAEPTLPATEMPEVIPSPSVTQLPVTVPTYAAEPAAPGVPVLYFSDLISGPRTGNSDTSHGRSGQDGAIVTVWGVNLGSNQGDSLVYANGAPAASIYLWGDATAPADLFTFHHMQMVSFQVSSLAQDGEGEIFVVVGGIQSNRLPFTVRDGNIYFAQVNGSDETGDGSWERPWRSIPFTASQLAAGDIAYIGDGVNQLEETDFSAAVNLGSNGLPGAPIALAAYPAAIVQVGNPALERAFHVWNGETGSYSTDWVLSKFIITTGTVGVTAQSGFRVVGNYVTAPQGNGMDGAIGGLGNDVYILGNELENVGSLDCSKLYHAIYISGPRQGDAPRLAAEGNREVAWNYLHDNQSNRAINVYSEEDNSAFISNHRIHDNVIINQRGDGILLGYYVVGQNWIYNNLIVNAGLGPEWVDDPSSHTGLRMDAGHEQVGETELYIFNNTLFGNGWSGAAWPGENGSLLISPQALERSTTIYFYNNLVYSTGQPYLAGDSAALPAGDYRNGWYGAGPAPLWDSGAVSQEPLFYDPLSYDFRLQAGSPAVDIGLDLTSYLPVNLSVWRDLLGNPRPLGVAYDLGAYEMVP